MRVRDLTCSQVTVSAGTILSLDVGGDGNFGGGGGESSVSEYPGGAGLAQAAGGGKKSRRYLGVSMMTLDSKIIDGIGKHFRVKIFHGIFLYK